MDYLKKQRAYITDTPHYILENKKVRVTYDLYEWAEFLEKPENKIVKQDRLPNGLFISTVFLGLDYNFLRTGQPLLFETMVFNENIKNKYNIGDHEFTSLGEDLYEQRYSTYNQALKGHEKALEKFKNYPNSDVKQIRQIDI